MIPNDSKDYYPTPPALAAELLAGLKTDGFDLAYAGGPILEPSAGSGALARAIEKSAGIAYNSDGTRDDYQSTNNKYRLEPCSLTASRSPPPSAPPSQKTASASSATISSPSRPAPTTRRSS